MSAGDTGSGRFPQPPGVPELGGIQCGILHGPGRPAPCFRPGCRKAGRGPWDAGASRAARAGYRRPVVRRLAASDEGMVYGEEWEGVGYPGMAGVTPGERAG